VVEATSTTWLADYCGISGEMIERHYGRYLRNDTPAQLAKLTGNLAGTLPRPKRQVVEMVGEIASGGGEIRTLKASKRQARLTAGKSGGISQSSSLPPPEGQSQNGPEKPSSAPKKRERFPLD